MATNDPETDPVERALRLFVYAPVGLACYLRDSTPTFLELFVSRGRREVENAWHTVEDKLGRTPPEPTPSPSMSQRVADGLGRVASQAGTVGAAVAGKVVNVATTATGNSGTAPAPSAPSAASASDPAPAPDQPAPPTAPPPAGTSETNGTDLPIPGYDLLSASQVIERLEGLSRGALDRIRLYELAHRARRTILASIDQLTS